MIDNWSRKGGAHMLQTVNEVKAISKIKTANETMQLVHAQMSRLLILCDVCHFYGPSSFTSKLSKR